MLQAYDLTLPSLREEATGSRNTILVQAQKVKLAVPGTLRPPDSRASLTVACLMTDHKRNYVQCAKKKKKIPELRALG